MPKDCAECHIEGHYENSYGDEYGFFCPLGYKAYTQETRDTKRLDDCPLVKIPSNVRLIDANALLKEFDYGKDVNWRDLNESLVHKTGIWAEILCAPTIFEEDG